MIRTISLYICKVFENFSPKKGLSNFAFIFAKNLVVFKVSKPVEQNRVSHEVSSTRLGQECKQPTCGLQSRLTDGSCYLASAPRLLRPPIVANSRCDTDQSPLQSPDQRAKAMKRQTTQGRHSQTLCHLHSKPQIPTRRTSVVSNLTVAEPDQAARGAVLIDGVRCALDASAAAAMATTTACAPAD